MRSLVSCVLVTKDRPAFFRQALRYYTAQDYPNKELVVVDDGETPVEDACAGVPDLKYIRLQTPTTTGTKLNIGIDAARGDILQKIDDDDFYAPAFLSTSVGVLMRTRSADPLVAWCCFAVLLVREQGLFFSGHGWKAGGTLCFRRGLWKKVPFRDLRTSSDSCFIRDTNASVIKVCETDKYMVVRHGANTWHHITGFETAEHYFRLRPYRRSVRRLVGARHAPFYESLMAQA